GDVHVVGRRVDQGADLARAGVLRGPEGDGDVLLARRLADPCLLTPPRGQARGQAQVDVVAGAAALQADQSGDRAQTEDAGGGACGRGELEHVRRRHTAGLDLLDAAEGARREAGHDLQRRVRGQFGEAVRGGGPGAGRIAVLLELVAEEAGRAL